MKFLLVALAVAAADVAWTLYFIETERRRALLAGFWSSVIVALGAYSVVEYTHDRRLVWAAVVGAFIGTSVTVWCKRKKT